MTRVFTEAWEGYDSLKNGLLVLFACAAAAAVLVTRILASWSKHIRSIEQALGVDSLDLPPLPMSGEQELDRIIAALNQAGERLGEARRQSEQLNRPVATAERLASLGRLAAGLAHEIRNPIAAMRLKAENALAKGSQHTEALKAIIEQIDRLDRLVGQVLTASGKHCAKPMTVAMTDFLAETIKPYQDLAKAKGVAFRVTGTVEEARLDPGLTRRALDNLITNSIHHTGRGGQVALAAKREAQRIIIEVADTGPGVAAEIVGALFEPFVSGRDGGTGLGLAIAREAIESQGGHLHLVPSEAGALFQIELPG